MNEDDKTKEPGEDELAKLIHEGGEAARAIHRKILAEHEQKVREAILKGKR